MQKPQKLSAPKTASELMVMPTFTEDDSKSAKAAIVGPLVNDWIASYERKEMGGVETFQAALVDKLEQVDLIEERWVHPRKVIVHPDNRERVGLVPIDAHDLLLIVGGPLPTGKGWNWAKVDALAAELPDGVSSRKPSVGSIITNKLWRVRADFYP